MSIDIALRAVKQAMKAAEKANLIMNIGKGAAAMTEEELEQIEQNATAIMHLANAITTKAQEANKRIADSSGTRTE